MIDSGAIFSECKRYRYVLWRIWDNTLPKVLLIGLNPSTADATKDDPTMRRCGGFARDWGFGGFYMCNLFAWKATSPVDLKKAKAAVGPENDQYILAYHQKAAKTVFCWGVHGDHLGRDEAIKALIPDAYYIDLTKHGHPRHPLYLKKGLGLQPIHSKRHPVPLNIEIRV